MCAQPHAAAASMLQLHSVHGNYSDKLSRYEGRDIIPPLKSAAYTSNTSSKGIDYSLNLGSSSIYNNGSAYSPSKSNSLYSVLSAYK